MKIVEDFFSHLGVLCGQLYSTRAYHGGKEAPNVEALSGRYPIIMVIVLFLSLERIRNV